MDEGFEEQLDINDTCDSVECSLSPSDWPRYFQERTSRQVAYFEKKNDFIFNVRLAFFNIHAFDLGVISYDKYEYLMISKVENMRKYATDFQYPFMAFEFIVYAIFCGEDWDENVITLYNDMYLMVFPEASVTIDNAD